MPRLIAENIKSQILPLYKSGLSYREVGDRLGISHITVGRYVRESGYDRTHVGSKIAKSIPIANERPQKPSEAPQSRDTFRVISLPRSSRAALRASPTRSRRILTSSRSNRPQR